MHVVRITRCCFGNAVAFNTLAECLIIFLFFVRVFASCSSLHVLLLLLAALVSVPAKNQAVADSSNAIGHKREPNRGANSNFPRLQMLNVFYPFAMCHHTHTEQRRNRKKTKAYKLANNVKRKNDCIAVAAQETSNIP